MPIYPVLSDYRNDITLGNRRQRHARGAVELITLLCRRRRTESTSSPGGAHVRGREDLRHLLSSTTTASICDYGDNASSSCA
eukprot:7533223-Heterocapsa_arctica.AAC.1